MSTLSTGTDTPTAWVPLQNDVHIWQAPVHVTAPEMLQMQQWLAPDEHRRAQRFYFDKDRAHFIVARGSLRKILGLYLGISPGEVRFQYNAYGKPALDLPAHPLGSRLRFNISHSHELILSALALDKDIGIDVEFMRANIEHEALAAHHFSDYEQQALNALPTDQKFEGFYNCWTRKEAYIKARGQGLSLPLHLFDVTLAPGQPAALIDSRESSRELDRWSMYALAPGTSYAGALVVEGHQTKLRYFIMTSLNDFSFL